MNGRPWSLGLLALTLTAMPGTAQHAPAPPCSCPESVPGTPDPALAGLVAEALAGNPTLRGSRLALDASRASVDAARARFHPTLAMEARTTRADGGRTLEFPVGDLLNPVYGALNDLTATDAFSPISNVRTPLLRPREQDTRLRVTQVIWSPAASAETRRRERDADAAESDLAVQRRRVVLDVTLAWYAWIDARRAVEIQRAALDRVAEHERVAARRLAADLVTPDVVARARAERWTVDEAVAQAEAGEADARARVNLLRHVALDAPLPAPTEVVFVPTAPGAGYVPLPSRRPELDGLDRRIGALEAAADAAAAQRRPTLAVAVDAGLQGADYGLAADDRFVTGSLVVTWPLFDRTVDAEARALQARARSLRASLEATAAAVDFEVDAARRAFTVAMDGIARAAARLAAAELAFRLVERRVDEGLATPLEFLDARAALTDARLAEASSRTAALAQLARWRHALGLDAHVPALPDAGASP